MRLKKNLILDLVYSVIFSIGLLLTVNPLSKLDQGFIFIAKNFVSITILGLWIKALSRENPSIFLIKDYPASKNSPFKSSYTLLKDFIEMKIACFVLMYCIYTYFSNTFSMIALEAELLRIILIGFYTLFVLLICSSYLKVIPSHWSFVALTLGPFILFFIVAAIIDLKDISYFAMLPVNFEMIFLYPIDNPKTVIVVGISLILFVTMILFFIKAVKRLLTGTKYLKLDFTRVN